MQSRWPGRPATSGSGFGGRVPMISFIIIFQAVFATVFAVICRVEGSLQAQTSGDWNSSVEDSWTLWWSHSGVSGPSSWGLLNADWQLCDKGRRQSPVNIDTKQLLYDQSLTALKVSDQVINGLLLNDGHAIVLNFTAATLLVLDDEEKQQQQQHKVTINSSPTAQGATVLSEAATPHSSEIGAVEFANSLQGSGFLVAAEQQLDEASKAEQADIATRVSASAAPKFSGAGLGYAYILDALVLRFGAGNTRDQAGSEHRINNVGFDAELQLLAYNSHLYNSLHEASIRPHGLLAVGILIKTINDQNASARQPSSPTQTTSEAFPQQQQHRKQSVALNEALERIVSRVDAVKFRNERILLEAFNVSQLLSSELQNGFVTYEGSLTSPACFEAVTWILLNKPLYMRQSALENLRSVSADEQSNAATGAMIAGNVRPIQPTNGRSIRTNIHPSNNLHNQEACSRFISKFEYTLTSNDVAQKVT